MTNPLRTLIVDDEKVARLSLSELLKKHPDIVIVGEAASGPKALESIRALQPDLVFLDIQMPGQDGVEVARAVAGQAAPVIVFVTAFDQHTVAAFNVAAVDYVLKPYSDSRFHQAVERAKRRCRGGDKVQLARAVDAALQALAGKKPASRNLAKVAGRIVVKVDGELHFVEMGDIRWIAADGDFARLHLLNGSLYSRVTLRELSEQLDPERFCRIHKSHIVNLAFIRHHRNDEQHGPILTLDDGRELPVGPSYKPDLSRRLF